MDHQKPDFFPHTLSYQSDYNRREFISNAARGIMFAMVADTASFQPELIQGNIKAVVFDGFAIFDPRPVFALTENLFPGKGKEIAEIWRTKQFEYTWLRESGGQYKNFREVTADALVFATRKAQVSLNERNKKSLLDLYYSLEPWPDVLPVLDLLKSKNLKLGFLSNLTDAMLDGCIQHSNLKGYFDAIISTDLIRTYKPSRRSYQMGVDAFRLRKSEILFVAFAGWDAAGAKWFGYPVYWVNRLQLPGEELNVVIDMSGKTLDGIGKLIS
jgi:2-haloacid dehalogenase